MHFHAKLISLIRFQCTCNVNLRIVSLSSFRDCAINIVVAVEPADRDIVDGITELLHR